LFWRKPITECRQPMVFVDFFLNLPRTMQSLEQCDVRHIDAAYILDKV
jgi:hypothetical protein